MLHIFTIFIGLIGFNFLLNFIVTLDFRFENFIFTA